MNVKTCVLIHRKETIIIRSLEITKAYLYVKDNASIFVHLESMFQKL